MDDVVALTDIYVSSARHHATMDPGYYRVPERQAVARQLREELPTDDPERRVRLVAEVDGAVVGSAEVALKSPSPASMIRSG